MATMTVDDLITRLVGDEKHAPSAHSTREVLWVLYDRVLRVSPATVDYPARDRFLLSKGHGPMAFYATLAAKGFFPEAWLDDMGSWESPARAPPRPVARAWRGDLLRLARSRPAARRRRGARPCARGKSCGRTARVRGSTC
jgi:hypothetical protein